MTGSHVVLEEVDDTGADSVQVTRVIVNGVDVGQLARAPKIHVGTRGKGDLTTVTLTLVPSRLEVRGAARRLWKRSGRSSAPPESPRRTPAGALRIVGRP